MKLSLLFTVGCFALHQSPATSSALRGGPTTTIMLDLSASVVEEEERIDVEQLTLFHNNLMMNNGTTNHADCDCSCDCNNMPMFGFNGSTVPFLKKKNNNNVFATLIRNNKQPAVQISDTIAPLASSSYFFNNNNRGSGAYWTLDDHDDEEEEEEAVVVDTSVIASLSFMSNNILDDDGLNEEEHDDEEYHLLNSGSLLPVTGSPKVTPPLSRRSRAAKMFRESVNKNTESNTTTTSSRSWTTNHHHHHKQQEKLEGSSSAVLALLMASVLADLHATKVHLLRILRIGLQSATRRRSIMILLLEAAVYSHC